MGKKHKRWNFHSLPVPAEDILRGSRENDEWTFLTDEPASIDTLYSAINDQGTEPEEELQSIFGSAKNSVPSAVAESHQRNASSEEQQSTQSSSSKRKYVGQYEIAEYLVNHYSAGLYQDYPYVKVNGVHTPLTRLLVGNSNPVSAQCSHI